MPFKKLRDEYVWTPRQLSWRQRLAFRWPVRPPQNGEPRVSFGVLIALTLVAFIFTLFAGALMEGTVINVPLLIILFGALLVEGILVYFHATALQTLKRMRSDHAFRFPALQDKAPSFIVLDLFLLHRPPLLTPDQEDAIAAWLEGMWEMDRAALYGYSPWSSHVERSSLSYDAIAKAVDAFWDLPLALNRLDGFRAACDQLIDEYRRSFEDVLGRELESRREQIETARRNVDNIERKLEVLRAKD